MPKEKSQSQENNKETQNKEPKENKLKNKALKSVIYTFAGTGISFASLKETNKDSTVSGGKITNVELQAPITKVFEGTQDISSPTLESVATRIISPLSLVVQKQKTKTKSVEIVIPNEYNKANPSNPAEAAEQQAELSKIIDKQITQQTVGSLKTSFGSNILKDGINQAPGYTVLKAEVEGKSSFEFSSNGAESVKLNQIDQQNIILSKARAKNALEALNANSNAFNKINVSGVEVQPTQKDLILMLNTGKEIGLKGSNDEIILKVTQLINKNEIPKTFTANQLKSFQQIKSNLEIARNVTIKAEVTVNAPTTEVIGIPIDALTPLIGLSIMASKLIFNKKKPKKIEKIEIKIEKYKIEKLVPASKDKLLNDNIGQYRGFLKRLFKTEASNQEIVSDGLDLQAIIQVRVPQINKICKKSFESEAARDKEMNGLINQIANDIKLQLNTFETNRDPHKNTNKERTYNKDHWEIDTPSEIETIKNEQCRVRAEQIFNQTVIERQLWNRLTGVAGLKSMRNRVTTAFSKGKNFK